MPITKIPPFTLYVVWHPNCVNGMKLGNRLLHHFRSDRFQNVTGGANVDVLFRHEAVPNTSTPLPIAWDDASSVAAVLLIDNALTNDPDWSSYAVGLIDQAGTTDFSRRVIPVAIDREAIDILSDGTQALRWYEWSGDEDEKERRLIRDITDGFIRMLRVQLKQLQESSGQVNGFHDYLENVQVFLSHSKKDQYGQNIARNVRDWAHSSSPLYTFFDANDIPAGVPFSDVIYDNIRESVMLAIYTNSYSSREWCCREVLYAKSRDVPMVVVDCLTAVDERAFPYMGNVPVIRIEPSRPDVANVIGILLDETFKGYLWRCRVEELRNSHPEALFTSHHPELLSLGRLPPPSDGVERIVVYPEPVISSDEMTLFDNIASDVRLYSLRQWTAKEGVT